MVTPISKPTAIVEPFANNGLKNTIPVVPNTTPGSASLDQGFPATTMVPVYQGGVPPSGLDFNGILNWITQHTVWVNAGGMYTFDAGIVAATGGYKKGAVLMSDDLASTYVSLIDNNTVNFNTTPASISVQWLAIGGAALLARVAAHFSDYYLDTGSTANAYVVTGPDTSAAVSFRFRTTRANTGAVTLTIGQTTYALKTEQGSALAAGDIAANSITSVVYDPAIGYAVVTETMLSQLGTLARENIGQGLEDDGAGNLRVKLADTSLRRTVSGLQSNDPLTTVVGNLNLASSHHGSGQLMAGASPTITAPATSTLWNGYNVTIIAQGGPVNFAVNATDHMNGGAAGAGLTILQGQTVNIVTDGAGNWWPLFQTAVQGAFSPRYITTSQALGPGTYEIDTGAGPITITLPAGAAIGATLEFTDVAGTWSVNPLTLARNGNTILGQADNLIWNIAGRAFRIWFNGSDWRLF